MVGRPRAFGVNLSSSGSAGLNLTSLKSDARDVMVGWQRLFRGSHALKLRRNANLTAIADLRSTAQRSGNPRARRRDLRLIELAVRAGADVSAAKDERVRVFLKQFANHDSTLLADARTLVHVEARNTIVYVIVLFLCTPAANSAAHTYVYLDYRHQYDETIASRGSISLNSAKLKLPPLSTTSRSAASGTTMNDRMRIEVHAYGQKWYMKASHPVEAARWAGALRKNAEWARREEGEASSVTVGVSFGVSVSGLTRGGIVDEQGGGGGRGGRCCDVVQSTRSE
ncbi:hypothetical protein E4T56_gene12191 [Termitomyces sp. T112]|nr:hypothetical protein E4T56_gene12191 [Termitomyces sp. T112]